MKLSSEHRTLMNFDTTARAKTIETQVQNDEDQMRNLQRQIETIEVYMQVQSCVAVGHVHSAEYGNAECVFSMMS